MPDDHAPGWLDPEGGVLAERRKTLEATKERFEELDGLIHDRLFALDTGLINALSTPDRPARVYVHASPKLSPETNHALRELVGRAIQAMGNKACSEIPEGLSVRTTFRGGAAIVEPADD